MAFENATPRPWKKFANYVYAAGEMGGNVCACSEPRASTEVGFTEPKVSSPNLEEAHANAELIVTAVNAHEALVEALEAFERWEADVILNGDWSSETVRLTQAQHDALSAVQDKRNAALKLARAES